MKGLPPAFSHNQAFIEEGDTGDLLPHTLTGVKWFSSNTHVATVKTAKLPHKSVGYTTISAYNANGSVNLSCACHRRRGGLSIPRSMGFINEDYVNLRSGPGTGLFGRHHNERKHIFTFISQTLYKSDWYHISLLTEPRVYLQQLCHKGRTAQDNPSSNIASTYVGCKYAFSSDRSKSIPHGQVQIIPSPL